MTASMCSRMCWGRRSATADGGVISADLHLFGDFGDSLTSPATATVTGFTGKSETAGLVEFAVRAFDPASRVWVQDDRYRGTTTRAASMNRYAYVEGAPESFVDVLGFYRARAALRAQRLAAAEAAYRAALGELGGLYGAALKYAKGWTAQQMIDFYNQHFASSNAQARAKLDPIVHQLAEQVVQAHAGPPAFPTIPTSARYCSVSSASCAYEQVQSLRAQPSSQEAWNSYATAQTENAAIKYAMEHGGRVSIVGEICGTYAVCIVDVDELGSGKNTITFGRVILSERDEVTGALAFHEFGHVADETDVNYDVFIGDYVHEAGFALAHGYDVHDGSIFEMWADDRRDAALAAYQTDGIEAAMEVYQYSIYDRGYEPAPGNAAQWAAEGLADKADAFIYYVGLEDSAWRNLGRLSYYHTGIAVGTESDRSDPSKEGTPAQPLGVLDVIRIASGVLPAVI